MALRPDFPLDPAACGHLLADPDTTATSLHLILLSAYGDDLYGDEDEPPMDPVLIWRLAREDFSVTIPEENENKVNAIMTGVMSDAFYADPLTFVSVCMALYTGDLGDLVSGVMEDPTLPELLWGIFEVALNRDDDMEFSPAVYAVVRKEMEDAAEEEAREFSYFERALIAGKTKVIEEMSAMGAPPEAKEQVYRFDSTPVHDAEGNLLLPDGSVLAAWDQA